MTNSVGFVGLGNMGNPMALNVLRSGFALTVFDINAKAMQNLVAAGAKGASSAAEVTAKSEVLLTCLPGSPEVEAFYLSAGGAIESAKAGTALVDLSSVLPSTSRKLDARAKARGLQFLEAPVSGGVTGRDACGYDYLLAYSCKTRYFCPSCHQKRVLLYGEWVAAKRARAGRAPESRLHSAETLAPDLRAASAVAR